MTKAATAKAEAPADPNVRILGGIVYALCEHEWFNTPDTKTDVLDRAMRAHAQGVNAQGEVVQWPPEFEGAFLELAVAVSYRPPKGVQVHWRKHKADNRDRAVRALLENNRDDPRHALRVLHVKDGVAYACDGKNLLYGPMAIEDGQYAPDKSWTRLDEGDERHAGKPDGGHHDTWADMFIGTLSELTTFEWFEGFGTPDVEFLMGPPTVIEPHLVRFREPKGQWLHIPHFGWDLAVLNNPIGSIRIGRKGEAESPTGAVFEAPDGWKALIMRVQV